MLCCTVSLRQAVAFSKVAVLAPYCLPTTVQAQGVHVIAHNTPVGFHTNNTLIV